MTWSKTQEKAPKGFAWWAHSGGRTWRLASDMNPNLDFQSEIRLTDGVYYDDYGGCSTTLQGCTESLLAVVFNEKFNR